MIRRQLGVFLLVGGLTVLIDFAIYRLLLSFSTGLLTVGAAKAAGFMAGTLFAYFANRRWTFGSGRPNRHAGPAFVLLYALTLGLNVLVNGLVLRMAGERSWALSSAFLIATAVSATLNFIGMKWFVFHAPHHGSLQ